MGGCGGRGTVATDEGVTEKESEIAAEGYSGNGVCERDKILKRKKKVVYL